MIEYLFYGGRSHALTMGFDDGYYDEKLIKIFNEYGIKETFYLNSTYIKSEENGKYDNINNTYSGHEVASHGATHRTLICLPPTEIYDEVYIDRLQLEKNRLSSGWIFVPV